MFTMFREGGKDSPVSMRRVLAAFFAIAFIVLGLVAMDYAPAGWFVFIPSALCIGAVILLLFFTTWADVAGAVKSIAGKE